MFCSLHWHWHNPETQTCWLGQSCGPSHVFGTLTQPCSGIGLPWNPNGQEHIVAWLTQLQTAFGPQTSFFLHGSKI